MQHPSPTDPLAGLTAALAARYTVVRPIGAGGMASVYLAEDHKHGRPVALKVLKPELGALMGVERFLGEIRVTAHLQHPHLLPLFDSGEAEGLLYYVMPYIEGETLRARLDREAQLPLDDAVRIAAALASAVDYAHQHGVIHRDLKPENVLLQAGQPVIADFGIALAVSNAAGHRLTGTGLTLGTPQYMSPEQAAGERTLDARTDVYSLGALTYEMLTGEPPHTGKTAQAVIARLMTQPPRPVSALRPAVPPHVEAAVQRALEKGPADRWQTARAFGDALSPGLALATPPASLPAAHGREPAARSERSRVLAVAPWLAFAAAATAAGVLWQQRESVHARPTVRFVVTAAATQPIVDLGAWPAISPDGRTLVYVGSDSTGRSVLYRRDLDDLAAHPIAGSAVEPLGPVFSPDGQSLVFWSQDQRVMRLPVEGGVAETLARVVQSAGWALTSRGTLVLGSRRGTRGLSHVTTPGSEPVVLTVPDTARGALAHGWPVPIGDGNSILFRATYRDSSRLALVDLDGGKPEVLPFDAAKPLGYTKGVLTYLRSDGVVMAVAFDLARRQATGTPVTLLEGISRDRVALGAGGDLLYIADRPIGRLTWADARGKRSYLPFGVGQYVWPRLSPDGTRIAVGGGQGSTWVYDITTGVPRRLAAQGIMPEWTPDGKRVLVASGQGTWSEPADGSGPPELLTKGTYFDRHVSPDGRTLIFIRDNMPASKSNDIWTMSLGPDRQLRPFVESPGRESNPRFSPDGGWVAYRTDESQRGRSEVYIRPFPGPGPATQISLGGGMQPVWGADGRRLYYARGAALYVATLSFGPSPRVIARDSLFDIGPANGLANHAHYDVARDGRILAVRYIDDGQSITVVLNWIDEVRRRLREASQR